MTNKNTVENTLQAVKVYEDTLLGIKASIMATLERYRLAKPDRVGYTVIKGVWASGEVTWTVEASNGGGIELEGKTVDEAVRWVIENNGVVDYVL